jgi:TRAP-type uncharacterized transport system substrate-binding protein
MKKLHLILALALAAFSGFAQAQSLAFATGEAKKGYSKVFANINDVCNASVPLKEVNTNGGLDNLTALADKSATVGISQIDTWLSLSGGDEAIGRLKGVASLNSNLMHIVVNKAGYEAGQQCSGRQIGGVCAGKREAVSKLIEKDTDLKGLRVAVVGSAQVLARTYLNKKLNLGLDLVDVDAAEGKSGDARAFAMLASKQVQAVITMAAYPSGPVSALKPESGFTLAQFTQQGSAGMRVVKKNYKNLGSFNVAMLSVPNILWARPVDPNGATGQQISALKACITANLKRFQDEEGFEPSWADATLALPDEVPPWTGKVTQQVQPATSSTKKK